MAEPQTQGQQQEQQDSKDRDTSTSTWLRRTRGQILRRAAGLTDDPAQGEAERLLLLAAQHLQEAGGLLKE